MEPYEAMFADLPPSKKNVDVPVTPTPENAPPVRLGPALRAGLSAAWDHIGLVIGVSLTWMLLLTLPLTLLLLTALPLVLRLGLFSLCAVFVLSAPTAGAFYVAHLICTHDEVFYTDLWSGARRMFGPATRLGLINGCVKGVLLVNIWFYLHVGHLAGGIAAMVSGYALLFWVMMAVYHFPLLAAQENGVFDEPERRAKRGAVAVLRRALFLALGDPLFTLGLLAAVVLATALLYIMLALPPLLWMGLLTLLITPPTRSLLMKYGVVPPPPSEDEIVPDEKFRLK